MPRRGYGPHAATSDSKPTKKGKKSKGFLGGLTGTEGHHDKGGFFSHIPSPIRSGLGAALNVLDKPGQAVRSGLAYASETAYKGGNPLKALGSFALGAGKGLIGKEHTSASQVVGAARTGHPHEDKLPFGVETVLGTVLDPTTYLSLGSSAAAKEGLKVAAQTLGKETAENVVKSGTRRALTADSRATLRQALVDNAVTNSKRALTLEKAEKVAAKQMKALDRTARGGVKFAGRSVPGLTAESTIGKAASVVNPKRVIGEALGASKGGRIAKDAFVRGAGAAQEAVGKDTASEIVRMVTGAEDTSTLRNVVTDSTAKNLVKEAGDLTEERLTKMRRALDIDEATTAARKEADKAFSQARKMDQDALKAQARHEGVSKFVDETLTAKRQVFEAAKAAVEHAAARIDGSAEARQALVSAQKTARIAATDLERTADKLATSSSRHGIAQMAGVLRTEADHAIEAAKAARANIPDNTKAAIAAMRAEGDNTLADLTEHLDTLRHKFTKEQVDAGLLKMGVHETGEYVPRVLTKEGKKAFERMAVEAADALSSPGRKVVSSTLKQAIHQSESMLRELRPDLSIEQLNEFLTTAIHSLPEGVAGPSLPAVLKPGTKAFEDNVVSLIVHRAHTAAVAVEHVNLVKKVAKMVGPDGKPLLREIEAGAKASNGKEVLDLVEDAGVRYEGDPAVVKLLNEARATTINNEGLKAVADAASEVSKVWRSLATFGPAFHARNSAGNFWLNYLGGVKNPIYYIRAGRIQKAAHEAFKSLGKDVDLDAAIAGLSLPETDKAIIKSALDEGVLTHGFFMEDLARAPEHLGGPKANPLKRAVGALNEGNKAAGSAIENNARLAHYIAKLEELGSTRAAADSVKKFLFDYGDLTAFEKHLKNFAIPFYTFMRKNTPLEIEQMLLNPGKFTKYLHLTQDLSSHGVNEQPDIPISSVEDVLRPITGTSQRGNITTSGLQRRAQGAVAPLNPLLKLLPELAAGASSFNGYPLRDTRAQAENALRNTLPPLSKVMSVPGKSWARNLLGFNDMSPAEPKGKKKGNGKKTPRRAYGG